MERIRDAQAFLGSLRWTLGLLWQSHAPITVIICILTLIQGVIPTAQLWVTKQLLDVVALWLAQPTTADPALVASIWQFVLYEAGLLLVGVSCGIFTGYTYTALGEHLTFTLQRRLLEHASRLDLASYESTAYYDRLQRAQEQSGQLPMLVLRRLLEFSQTLITLGSVVLLVWFYQPWLTILLILTALPSFIGGIHYGKQRYSIYNRRTAEGRLASYLSEVLTSEPHAREVRLWGNAPYLLNRWTEIRSRFLAENKRLAGRQALVTSAGEWVALVGYYGAYAVVIGGVINRTLTIGDLSLYAGAFSRVQSGVDALLSSWSQVYETQLYVYELQAFFALEPTITAPTIPTPIPALTQGIRLDNVSFTYAGMEKAALTEVSLTLKPDECVAVVGINGAGKSTLAKLLLRLYDPTTGTITWDGVDIRTLDPMGLRRMSAAVFQGYAQYHLTLRENVAFGNLDALHDEKMLTDALHAARLESLLSALPKGIDTPLGRRFEGGHELSQGQWQKVALARALVRGAPFLILDEPTASMDPQAEYDLYCYLKQVRQGRMTLLVSHRFSTVRMADRIIVLNDGRIVEEGTHDELLAHNALYAHWYRLQAEPYQDSLAVAGGDSADDDKRVSLPIGYGSNGNQS